MNYRIIILISCIAMLNRIQAQVQKTDIETSISTFSNVLTKTGAKLMIYSSNGNMTCVAAACKVEAKENAVYIYEYYDAKKIDLARFFVLPYSSIKDLYADSNLVGFTLTN